MMIELQISQLIAIIANSFFGSVSIYINFVEHPARMECGTEIAATLFPPSYKRAAVIQFSLAIISFVSSLLAWHDSSNIRWLTGGLIIFSVIPFTFIAIVPTNKKLLDPNLEKTSSVTRVLLLNWGKLHAVRSILSIISLLVFCSLVVSY
ncbi:MAG TPA: DUF1772 domain-containing protein [Thermodesulfobacteriota bacterium]|jgi:uncharacterized membrane protein